MKVDWFEQYNEGIKKEEQTERERHITTHQAAKIFGVTHTTVINWVNDGHIKCQKTLGGHRRIPMSEIEKVLAMMAPDFEMQE